MRTSVDIGTRNGAGVLARTLAWLHGSSPRVAAAVRREDHHRAVPNARDRAGGAVVRTLHRVRRAAPSTPERLHARFEDNRCKALIAKSDDDYERAAYYAARAADDAARLRDRHGETLRSDQAASLNVLLHALRGTHGVARGAAAHKRSHGD